MNDADIEATLKNLIVDRLFLKIKPEEIRSDVPLMDSYGVDSVSLLELVVGMEDCFGIRIEDGEFNAQDFSTVAALREFVKARLPA